MITIPFSIYNIEFFLLVFIRIISAVYLAPFWGSSNSPRHAKIGISFFLAMIVANNLTYTPVRYTTIIGYAVIVLKEVAVGLLIGFFANICMTIITFAGQIIDIDIGFSMVTLFDPVNRMQVSITGNFYQYLVLLVMIVTNMHFFVISALVDSFKVVPVGEIQYNSEKLFEVFLKFMQDYFIIGFRIVLPVFASILLLNAILAILAKASPQTNMFVEGLQLKVFLGMAVLVVTVMYLPSISDFVFSEMKEIVNLVIKAMYKG